MDLPTREFLEGACLAEGSVSSRLALAMHDEIERLQAIEAAVNRTEDVDISPCMECGKDCICIPDGLPVCSQACADKVGG